MRISKKKITVLICIFAALALIPAGFGIWCLYMHGSYVKPVITNSSLSLTAGEEDYTSYTASDYPGITYTVNAGKFPGYRFGLISIQAFQVLETGSSPHSISLTYRLDLNGSVSWEVQLNEKIPSDNGIDKFIVSTGGSIRLDSSGGFVSAHLTDLRGAVFTDEQSIAVYEKYREELSSLRTRMFEFFGEDSFKK